MKSLKNIAILGLFTFFGLKAFAQQIKEQDLRTNVEDIHNPLEQLKKLSPITFTYDTKKNRRIRLPKDEQYGFLTESAKDLDPGITKEITQVYPSGKNTTKVARYEQVDTESLLPLLVAAIKEQQIQIEALKAELHSLKGKN